MTVQTISGKTRDASGFAPGNTQACDAHEHCLGWILCDHIGTATDRDGWCLRCEAPTEGRTWTWCPERKN